MVELNCLEHKVIVHMARPDNLPQIFHLVDSYSDSLTINKNKAKNALRELVYINGVLLFKFDKEVIGGIAGFVTPSMFTDDTLFNVLFFYVKKDFRHLTKEIIKEFELVLLPTSVNKIIFGVLGNESYEKQKRFMRMMGYKELETHMVKGV